VTIDFNIFVTVACYYHTLHASSIVTLNTYFVNMALRPPLSADAWNLLLLLQETPPNNTCLSYTDSGRYRHQYIGFRNRPCLWHNLWERQLSVRRAIRGACTHYTFLQKCGTDKCKSKDKYLAWRRQLDESPPPSDSGS
jgi:hypothetical protein